MFACNAELSSAKGSAKPLPWENKPSLAKLVGAVVLLLFGGLLLIFHRPVLLTIGRDLARHYAAKENLRADFRLEGSVFTNLSVRNLHVVPTGRSAVESIDVDLVHVDYSLLGLIRHGMSQFLGSVDVRSARVVLNPRNAPEEIQ